MYKEKQDQPQHQHHSTIHRQRLRLMSLTQDKSIAVNMQWGWIIFIDSSDG